MFDKSGVNANRPGKFLFVCDECTTLNEIKNSQTIGDHIMHLKNEIESLKSAIDEMRVIIKTNIDVKNSKEEYEDKLTFKSKDTYAKAVIGNDANVISEKANIQNNNVNGNLPTTNATSRPDSSLNNTCTPISNSAKSHSKTQKSILIVEPLNDNPMINTENTTKAIEKLVVSNGVSIKNFYKNKNGKTIIVLQNEKEKENLKNSINNSLPSLHAKDINQASNKTICIVGFDHKYKENFVDSLFKQNKYISDFVAASNKTLADHIHIISIKPLKNNASLYQAEIKISTKLHSLLKNHGDKVGVGLRYCTVYDRINVYRCFKCQEYGHFASKCLNNFSCAHCAGDHSTSDCSNNNLSKCANCAKAGLIDQHKSYDPKCPVYRDEFLKRYDFLTKNYSTT